MRTPRVWTEYSSEPSDYGGHNHGIARYHIDPDLRLFRVFGGGVPSQRYFVAAGDALEAECIFGNTCSTLPRHLWHFEVAQVEPQDAESVLCDPTHNIIL